MKHKLPRCQTATNYKWTRGRLGATQSVVATSTAQLLTLPTALHQLPTATAMADTFYSTQLLQAIANSPYSFQNFSESLECCPDFQHDEIISDVADQLASMVVTDCYQSDYNWNLQVATQLPSPRHDSGVYSAGSDRSDESVKQSDLTDVDFFNIGKLLFSKSQRPVHQNYICYNCQGRFGTHHISECPQSTVDSGYQGFKECLSFFKCPNSGCSHKWFVDVSNSQDLQVCNAERCKARRKRFNVDPETEKVRPYHSFNPLNPLMAPAIIKELKTVMSQKLRWKRQDGDKLIQWCEAELHRIKRKHFARDV